MSLASTLVSKLLDGIDLGFDAAASLWRVAARGAFSADAKSYRNSRFAALAQSDVLVQEIALNAEDAGEARRAIALDPEGSLPLTAEQVCFDVVGPIASPALSARPERQFVLGVARKDRLDAVRAELPFGRRGQVEGFVFSASALPEAALVFEDPLGRRRRRIRRLALTLALALLAYTANDAFSAATSAFENASNAASAERASLERRIRVAEHNTALAHENLAEMAQRHDPTLGELSHELAVLAHNQAPDSALTSVTSNGDGLVLSGAAYSRESAELALRRSFERERVSFTAEPTSAAPAPFEARIDTAQSATP